MARREMKNRGEGRKQPLSTKSVASASRQPSSKQAESGAASQRRPRRSSKITFLFHPLATAERIEELWQSMERVNAASGHATHRPALGSDQRPPVRRRARRVRKEKTVATPKDGEPPTGAKAQDHTQQRPPLKRLPRNSQITFLFHPKATSAKIEEYRQAVIRVVQSTA